MADLLRQYIDSRKAVFEERVRLETRLKQINKALMLDENDAGAAMAAAAKPVKKSPAPASGKRARKTRAKNVKSLAAFVEEVLQGGAMHKAALTAEVEKRGYKFNSDKKVASVGQVLYSNKKKFKNHGGGNFSLAEAAAPAPQAPAAPAAPAGA